MHPASAAQYVLSLTGTLLFETWLGETFILKPGEILIAMDTTGSGHRWKLIDDQPWKRAYVDFENDEEINFLEESQAFLFYCNNARINYFKNDRKQLIKHT